MAQSRRYPFHVFEVGARTVRCFLQGVTPAFSTMECEWEPDLPAGMTAQEQAEYDAGLAAATIKFLARLTARSH